MARISRLGLVSILCLIVLSAGCAPQDPFIENTDWSNIWIPHANQDQKPRVLLVGDSISGGFAARVEDQMADEVYLGWYTTSKLIADPDFFSELEIILTRYDFAVIHANNGLHGWDYSEAEYEKSLREFVSFVQKHEPTAKIIWGSSTPLREKQQPEELSYRNLRVVRRNEIAEKIMGRSDIPINDLYELVIDHPEYYQTDGFHFNSEGKSSLADQVTKEIREILSE